MNKKIILVAATIIALLSFNSANAQSKRVERQQKRQEAKVYEADEVKAMLAKQSFFFQANQISWTTHPLVQNIMLTSSTYGVWVYPNNISVMLPIYGFNDIDVAPQLNRHLDFETGQYSYKVTPNFDETRWTIQINVTNPENLGQYTLLIMVDAEGRGTLTINSPLKADAIFNGDLFAQ